MTRYVSEATMPGTAVASDNRAVKQTDKTILLPGTYTSRGQSDIKDDKCIQHTES